jgi:hypothetical protein
MRSGDERMAVGLGAEPVTALRLAATVAHALPGLRLRLRTGDRTLLEVRRDVHGVIADGCGGAIVSACAFRRGVARLHEAAKVGPVGPILGGVDPRDVAIDIGVTSGDLALLGGVYRVHVPGADLHAFATTLSPRRCRALMAERSTSVARHPSSIDGPTLHRDVATEVTIVHVVVPVANGPVAGAPVERHPLLDDLLGACAAAEVEAALVRAAGG